MNAGRTRFGSTLAALLVGSALAFIPSSAGAAELQGGKGDASAQRSHGGGGTGSSRLKHLSTTVTTTEIWLPFFGWTVVCETVKVKCGPGGTNCPLDPQA